MLRHIAEVKRETVDDGQRERIIQQMYKGRQRPPAFKQIGGTVLSKNRRSNFVSVIVGRQSMKALVDTGSDVSLIGLL